MVRELTDRHHGQRGYFHRPNWLTGAKLGLSLAAVAVVGTWVAVDAAFPSRTAFALTHGPLASPHARWEANCNACHAEFSLRDVGPTSLFQPAARWRTLTCEKCHPGPRPHAELNREGDTFHAGCSNCHHDHGSQAGSLVRISDDHCTRCHGDLARHRGGEGSGVSPAVTGFASDHPEFRTLKLVSRDQPYDARKLKFSHGLHLTPGLVYAQGSRGALTVARLAEVGGADAAARYRRPGQTAGSPISLDCTSCHQQDTRAPETGALAAGTTSRTDQASHLPISFERHCRSCHPLQVPPGNSGSRAVRGFEVPHGQQAPALKKLVAGEFSRLLLLSEHPAMATPLGPGGRFDPRHSAELATFKKEVDRLSSDAVAVLFQLPPSPAPGVSNAPSGGLACAKCHDLAQDVPGVLPRVVEPPARAAWLPGAKFNHASHRAVNCQHCHGGTGASFFGDGWTAEKEPVRIPGIETCKQCHAPVQTSSSAARPEQAGVRHGCTDCHRYHNGGHPRRPRLDGSSDQPLAPLADVFRTDGLAKKPAR